MNASAPKALPSPSLSSATTAPTTLEGSEASFAAVACGEGPWIMSTMASAPRPVLCPDTFTSTELEVNLTPLGRNVLAGSNLTLVIGEAPENTK